MGGGTKGGSWLVRLLGGTKKGSGLFAGGVEESEVGDEGSERSRVAKEFLRDSFWRGWCFLKEGLCLKGVIRRFIWGRAWRPIMNGASRGRFVKVTQSDTGEG